MDPLVRELVNVPRSILVSRDYAIILDFYESLGKKLGFNVFRNYSIPPIKYLLVWKDKSPTVDFQKCTNQESLLASIARSLLLGSPISVYLIAPTPLFPEEEARKIVEHYSGRLGRVVFLNLASARTEVVL